MKSLENDLKKVESMDGLKKIIGDAIYFESDLRECDLNKVIRDKFKEFEVYRGVVVSCGYDCDLDLYYVLFWNEDGLTECVVRNEYDYYALENALKTVDLKYPVVLSANGVLKQGGIEIKFNEVLNVVVKMVFFEG